MQTPIAIGVTEARSTPGIDAVPIDWPLWVGTWGLASAVAFAIWLNGWSVVWPPLWSAMAAVVVLLSVGTVYRQTGRSAPLARLCLAIAHSLALAYVFQMSTYVVSASRVPLRSEALTRADALLGFSWTAWTAWVHSHPVLWTCFQVIHPLHFAAMTVAVTVLALATERGALRLLRAFTFAFVVSALALAIAPALTNTPGALSNALRLALRNGTFRVLDFSHTAGLISFPSMHAAMAVLAAAALWPYRTWRTPVTALAATLCIGAISEGGHYLVDILVGAPLGWVAWWLGGRSFAQT
jgi:membrane-associated phospholipid phosphatase